MHEFLKIAYFQMYILCEKLNHCIILQAYVVTVQSLSRMSSLFHSKELSERTRKHENLSLNNV